MTASEEVLITRPLSPSRLQGLDVLIAVAYTAALLLALRVTPDGTAGRVPEELRIGLVLLIGLPVAVRRRWPVGVLWLTAFAALVASVAGVTRDGFLAPALALYLIAARGERMPSALTRGAMMAGVLGLLLLVGAGSPRPGASGIDAVIIPIVLLAGAWTIGRAVAERRRYTARMASEAVDRAIAEERLRIARDLHDVVAHGLGLMVVTAANAGHVLDARPDAARTALRTVETTGRAALTEMRHLLDVLRAEPIADGAELAPTPGIRELTDLARRVTEAGVPVRLELRAVDDLPDGVAITVFRIVQEALTNVVRHAQATECIVRVQSVGDVVEVDITDDGRASPHVAGAATGERIGHGLLGMRERVRTLGGQFDAGPLPGRGFRVSARIPRGGTA